MGGAAGDFGTKSAKAVFGAHTLLFAFRKTYPILNPLGAKTVEAQGSFRCVIYTEWGVMVEINTRQNQREGQKHIVRVLKGLSLRAPFLVEKRLSALLQRASWQTNNLYNRWFYR